MSANDGQGSIRCLICLSCTQQDGQKPELVQEKTALCCKDYPLFSDIPVQSVSNAFYHQMVSIQEKLTFHDVKDISSPALLTRSTRRS